MCICHPCAIKFVLVYWNTSAIVYQFKFYLSYQKQCGCNLQITMTTTEATRQQSLHYGCIVLDKETSEVKHFVEKPSTFVSTLINCGVYLCSVELFQTIAAVFNSKQEAYYK